MTDTLENSIDRLVATALRIKAERDALRTALTRFVTDYDPECPPDDMPDAGCIECTAGTVPNHRNTGLCKYHEAVMVLERCK